MSSSRALKKRKFSGSAVEQDTQGALGRNGQINETRTSQDLVDQAKTCAVWFHELKDKRGWGWNKSGGAFAAFALFPDNLLKAGYSMGLIRKHGEEGVHYALGYPALQEMIDQHGLDYAPEPNNKMVQVQAARNTNPANANHQAPAAATTATAAPAAVVVAESPNMHPASATAPVVTPVLPTAVQRLAKLENELGINPNKDDSIPTRLEQVECKLSVTSEGNDTIKIRIEKLEQVFG